MNHSSDTNLVQQGLTAARVGELDEARRLLREATRQNPDDAEAWLALAGVVDSLPEKQRCFETVLNLSPGHPEAADGLARVQQKLVEQSPPEAEASGDNNDGAMFCYRHPTVETGLRCNRCGKPICPKCAHRTPVGFRCPDCIRQQEDKYYSGGNMDYVIAAVVAFLLSMLGAALFTYVLGSIGFFMILIAFFLAPVVAGFIAEAVRWSVGRRRSRYLGRVAAVSLVLATLLIASPVLLSVFLGGSFWSIISPALFAFLGASTVMARLR